MIPFLMPLLMTALGAGTSIYAQQEAARRQQEATQMRFQNQMNAEKDKNAALMQGADQYRPETRQETYQKAQGDSVDQLMGILKSTPSDLQNVTVGTAGNTGQDYDLANAKATAASKDKAYTLARLMGRTDAPAAMFSHEAGNMAKAQNNAMMVGNFAQGQDLLDQQRITNAGQVNPWLSMGGSLLAGYGMDKMGDSGLFTSLDKGVQHLSDKLDGYLGFGNKTIPEQRIY